MSVGLQWCDKRWEGKKPKHTSLLVSTPLKKYRQKLFNDVFTDPVEVNLQHVALIPLHPCILHREFNVTLKCEIVLNCSGFVHAFFISFNACFLTSLKLSSLVFLFCSPLKMGGVCLQYTAVVRDRKLETLSCLVWGTEVPIRAFWRSVSIQIINFCSILKRNDESFLR